MRGNAQAILIWQTYVEQYKIELLGHHRPVELQRASHAKRVKSGVRQYGHENAVPEFGVVLNHGKPELRAWTFL
jgi:hypothetical protein